MLLIEIIVYYKKNYNLLFQIINTFVEIWNIDSY